MKTIILLLISLGFVLVFKEISKLRRKVEEQEQLINKLCNLGKNKTLSIYYVSDDLKLKLNKLKENGKEVEAIRKLRDKTNMTLLEAKQFVERL